MYRTPMHATKSPPSLFNSALSQLADSLKQNPAANAPENDYEAWLRMFFPQHVTVFAPHHREIWNWVTQIQAGEKPEQPLVAILPRGGGKSSTAELATVYLGALKRR